MDPPTTDKEELLHFKNSAFQYPSLLSSGYVSDFELYLAALASSDQHHVIRSVFFELDSHALFAELPPLLQDLLHPYLDSNSGRIHSQNDSAISTPRSPSFTFSDERSDPHQPSNNDLPGLKRPPRGDSSILAPKSKKQKLKHSSSLPPASSTSIKKRTTTPRPVKSDQKKARFNAEEADFSEEEARPFHDSSQLPTSNAGDAEFEPLQSQEEKQPNESANIAEAREEDRGHAPVHADIAALTIQTDSPRKHLNSSSRFSAIELSSEDDALPLEQSQSIEANRSLSAASIIAVAPSRSRSQQKGKNSQTKGATRDPINAENPTSTTAITLPFASRAHGPQLGDTRTSHKHSNVLASHSLSSAESLSDISKNNKKQEDLRQALQAHNPNNPNKRARATPFDRYAKNNDLQKVKNDSVKAEETRQMKRRLEEQEDARRLRAGIEASLEDLRVENYPVPLYQPNESQTHNHDLSYHPEVFQSSPKDLHPRQFEEGAFSANHRHHRVNHQDNSTDLSKQVMQRTSSATFRPSSRADLHGSSDSPSKNRHTNQPIVSHSTRQPKQLSTTSILEQEKKISQSTPKIQANMQPSNASWDPPKTQNQQTTNTSGKKKEITEKDHDRKPQDKVDDGKLNTNDTPSSRKGKAAGDKLVSTPGASQPDSDLPPIDRARKRDSPYSLRPTIARSAKPGTTSSKSNQLISSKSSPEQKPLTRKAIPRKQRIESSEDEDEDTERDTEEDEEDEDEEDEDEDEEDEDEEDEDEEDEDEEDEDEEDEDEEDEQQWAADDIIGQRVVNGETQYLIKWTGYPESASTWEPESNVGPGLLAAWNA